MGRDVYEGVNQGNVSNTNQEKGFHKGGTYTSGRRDRKLYVNVVKSNVKRAKFRNEAKHKFSHLEVNVEEE